MYKTVVILKPRLSIMQIVLYNLQNVISTKHNNFN